MNHLIKNIRSEIIKVRYTRIAFISVGVTFFVSFLFFLIFYIKHENFARTGINPWMTFVGNELNTLGMLYPFYLMLIAFLITQIEHKANAWKFIYSLPSHKINFYLSKLILVIWWVFLSVIAGFAFTMFFGTLLSYLRPDIGFQDYNVNTIILQSFTKLFLTSLPIVIIQVVFSLAWPNFFRSIGTGVFLFIFCVVFLNWEKSYLLPYSFIFLVSQAFQETKSIFFDKTVIAAILYSLIFFLFGYVWIKQRVSCKV